MDRTRKNVALLAACQALLLTNNAILIATNGLAGFLLAPNPTFATLPVTCYILGAAMTTVPASFLMRRWGRRAGFRVGAMFGILGALICACGAYFHAFPLLCGGALVLGVYNATGQYYRFAAADVVSPEFKSKAISLVLAGGIVGGMLGPESSKYTTELLAQEFTGSYISLAAFCVLAMVLFAFIEIPPLTAQEQASSVRPLHEIARQPAFIIAVLSATIGYGIMNLLMTATPLAMRECHFPFSDAAFVIQWHVVGMFAPSFFTGTLIKRYGVVKVMLAGVVLNLGCVGFALSGVDLMHFWLALVLVGIGWNFMFIGGTTLLTECHTPAERAKAQGANDMAIFITMAVSSLSSGVLFTLKGWDLMNLLAAPILLMTGAAILWFRFSGRRAANS